MCLGGAEDGNWNVKHKGESEKFFLLSGLFSFLFLSPVASLYLLSHLLALLLSLPLSPSWFPILVDGCTQSLSLCELQAPEFRTNHHQQSLFVLIPVLRRESEWWLVSHRIDSMGLGWEPTPGLVGHNGERMSKVVCFIGVAPTSSCEHSSSTRKGQRKVIDHTYVAHSLALGYAILKVCVHTYMFWVSLLKP